jgi:hypothetical protein
MVVNIGVLGSRRKHSGAYTLPMRFSRHSVYFLKGEMFTVQCLYFLILTHVWEFGFGLLCYVSTTVTSNDDV